VRKRDEAKIKRLGLQRNKALKDAEQKLKMAAAKEDKRKAELKRAEADYKLRAESRATMERRKKKAKETISKVTSSLKKLHKQIKKKR